MSVRHAILITGGSGFLGSLVAATALLETDDTIVLPLRGPFTRERVLAPIVAELAAEGRPARSDDLARIVTLPFPAPDRIDALLPALRELGVRDVLHCAGSLSYFNVRKLQAGNLDLTSAVLALGSALDVRRFVYLSTAYSAGLTDRPIPETLHQEPRNDPTEYTRTKREAEWLVARSGLPYVIVRPSIVIGDSRDWRYGGKPYGIYQLWTAGGRYFSNTLPRILHVVAGAEPVNLLHQDALKTGFWAAYRTLPDGAILHLVSREDGLPTMRDLWGLWLSVHGGPHEVHFFDRLEDVPLGEVASEMRLWLDFTAVNNEIGSARWNFRHDRLETLRRSGLEMTDATLATIAVAQRRFVDDTPRLQRFVRRYRAEGAAAPRLVDRTREATRSHTARAS